MKFQKKLKNILNESYDRGEYFDPPIGMYQGRLVEVTDQEISELSIFADFHRYGTLAILGAQISNFAKLVQRGDFAKTSEIRKMLTFAI